MSCRDQLGASCDKHRELSSSLCEASKVNSIPTTRVISPFLRPRVIDIASGRLQNTFEHFHLQTRTQTRCHHSSPWQTPPTSQPQHPSPQSASRPSPPAKTSTTALRSPSPISAPKPPLNTHTRTTMKPPTSSHALQSSRQN